MTHQQDLKCTEGEFQKLSCWFQNPTTCIRMQWSTNA